MSISPGALGFEPVASLCRELEEACTQEGNVAGLSRKPDDACALALFETAKLKSALRSTSRPARA